MNLHFDRDRELKVLELQVDLDAQPKTLNHVYTSTPRTETSKSSELIREVQFKNWKGLDRVKSGEETRKYRGTHSSCWPLNGPIFSTFKTSESYAKVTETTNGATTQKIESIRVITKECCSSGSNTFVKTGKHIQGPVVCQVEPAVSKLEVNSSPETSNKWIKMKSDISNFIYDSKFQIDLEMLSRNRWRLAALSASAGMTLFAMDNGYLCCQREYSAHKLKVVTLWLKLSNIILALRFLTFQCFRDF